MAEPEKLQTLAPSDPGTNSEEGAVVAFAGGGGGGEKEIHEAEEEEEDDDDEEEREIQELEKDVEEMAEKIRCFRRTIPDRLAEALSSSLIAQRPQLPAHLVLEDQNPDSLHTAAEEEQSSSSKGAPLEADQEVLEKLSVFRSKTSSNMQKMPKVLARMKACIARIERINGYNMNISSVFRKKRKL